MFGLFKKKEPSDMWLIAGLGNPDDKYKNHRHNIGFMVLDHMADHFDLPSWRGKFQSEMAEGRIEDQKVVLLKPQTYMNNSGQGIKAACKFFKIEPSRVIVIHDELDLAAGKMRIKKGGGAAGHNGLKSTQAHLGTPDFWRVRAGIGHPGDKSRVHGYVLSDFAKAEQEWLPSFIGAMSRNISCLLDGAEEDYMTRVAKDSPVPKEKKKAEGS